LSSAIYLPSYNLDSTTPLAANASFVGNPISNLPSSFIEAEASSDQTGTLYVDFSDDNFITVAFTVSAACGPPSSPVVAGTLPNSAQIKSAIYAKYLRIRFVNGTTKQTAFQLSHRFSNA
jgi:hypothetical protein